MSGETITDGLEGASREELLRQLRTCRSAMLRLSHDYAAQAKRLTELEANAARIVRPEPMTTSELIGLAFFQTPSESREEELLEEALDLAADREGRTVGQQVLGPLVARVALLAERDGGES